MANLQKNIDFSEGGEEIQKQILSLQHRHINIISMETTVLRRSTSFRLKTDLLLVLKQQAKECNTSLNKYVEHILCNAAYEEPNKITMQAIQEAKSGLRKETEIFDNVNDLMAFLKSWKPC